MWHSLSHFLVRGMTIEKERLIYTAGTFKIDDNLAKCRRLIVRTSVLRYPFSAIYRNERSNPPKYFLGYVSLFIGSYVSGIFPLEFEQQIVLLWDNLASQVYARVICDAININLFTAAARASIPLAGGVIATPGDPGTFPGCPYNFIKFKLEPGARILVTGVGEEVESCEGGVFDTTVPDLAAPPPLYPDDQARDEDPGRSAPEDGELPGDTAPATVEDPDASLTIPPCTMTVGLRRADLNTVDFVNGPVPNSSYTTAFLTVIGPGTIYIVQSTGDQGSVTIAGPFNPGSVVITVDSVSVVC